MFRTIDRIFITGMHKWGITALRLSVAAVFLWFGALKLAGYSPVVDLVMDSFSFLPFVFPFTALGVLEVAIGLGLLFKTALRVTLGLMWLMLVGTFASLILNPELFFNGNFFLLSTEGEFVIKNLVLIASGLVIGGKYVEG